MRKRYLLTSACISMVVGSPALAEDMLVERVRYCTKPGIENVCGSTQLNSKFKEWNTHGVETQEQLETYISIINQPERSKVKRVVFVSAGQQINDGYPNALTGQPDKYKKDCKNQTKNCMRPIHPMSLVGRLRASGEFDDSETLYISALDAKFGYFRSVEQKQNRENAYWDFLTSKFDPSNVELMVLAGQSRGGCLMYRLGSRMRKSTKHQNIPLIVQGYDPVCTTPDLNVDGLELPAGNVRISPTSTLPTNKVNNPLNSSFISYIVNMDKVFPAAFRDNLKVLNIHAGGKVGSQNVIRSFTWYNKDTDIGWWKQKWVNYEHNDMGGYLTSASATAHARPAIGDVGYAHIYNYSKYELGRPDPTNFRAKPRYPVDVNGDRKSDIILAYRDRNKGLTFHTKISNGDGTFSHKKHVAGDGVGTHDWGLHSGYFNKDSKTDILAPYQHKTQGLILRTKMSNGDGTYSEKSHIAGDGVSANDLPMLIGDIDGDGLSDVIMPYQHPTDGLRIRTKTSNGDGSFNNHDFKAGDGNLGKTLRVHAGDVNGDKKTDLIYLYQRGSDEKMEVRTRTSNGDGTFGYSKTLPLHYTPWTNIQSFVADVNRDGKSDLIVLERGNKGQLEAHTFFFKPDGNYDRVIEKFSDGPEVDAMETIVADVNGDRRTDIVMRVRDKTKGLILRVKLSQGNGHYTSSEYSAGDGASVDNLHILSGHYDSGRHTDLALRYRHSQKGLIFRTKHGTSQGSFTEKEFASGDGSAVDKMEALSGPVFWDGGATFNPPRESIGSSTAPAVNVNTTVKPGIGLKPVESSKPIARPLPSTKKALPSSIKPKKVNE
ncbi:VCBS repeat protein [Litorimonas taeanensis]|uniref:VCBS repeat protein n=1 Tax=Litorimonas taeanensis TaxID=568099 RepID=A0A420WDZ4_9PROT|nr:VCBS repeat-containing protein [Litorimonas taeanensis]RKQ69130.1 VCBS repeat protein [Litorimonas taeanensis]